jgi:hypothetical protein
VTAVASFPWRSHFSHTGPAWLLSRGVVEAADSFEFFWRMDSNFARHFSQNLFSDADGVYLEELLLQLLERRMIGFAGGLQVRK